MGMFEMSDDQVAKRRQQCLDLVAPHVNGEEVLAAAGGLPDKVMPAVTPDRLYAFKGEKATLVGISVKDDPVSQELIGALLGGTTANA